MRTESELLVDCLERLNQLAFSPASSRQKRLEYRLPTPSRWASILAIVPAAFRTASVAHFFSAPSTAG